MSGVTYARKRYVSECIGCERLFDSVRRDQVTCSTACRVRAHRSGALKRRHSQAEALRITPALIGHGRAMHALRPDLEAKVMAGEATFEDIMPELVAAYDERIRSLLLMT